METTATAMRPKTRTGTLPAAEAVLAQWGLSGSRCRVLGDGVNKTLRVEAPGSEGAEGRAFVLRLYEASQYDSATIRSELEWLEHLRGAGSRVPEPVASQSGQFIVPKVESEGSEYLAVLFHWLPGEPAPEPLSATTSRRLGELMARFHRHSERFRPAPGFLRPRYDLTRLLGLEGASPVDEGCPLFSSEERKLFAAAATKIRQRLGDLEEAAPHWGLVHGDLQVTNYLFEGGEAGIIDFADSGWGFFLYDIAVSLLPVRRSPAYEALKEAFLRGYTRVRPLAPDALDQLETFLAARCLFILRWTVETWHVPSVRETAREILPFVKAQLLTFLGEEPAGNGAEGGMLGLLEVVRQRGIRLWEEDGKLRFKAPQGTMTGELRAEVARHKAELILFLRQHQQAGRPRNEAPMEPVPRQPHMPLSFAQERLWILHRLEPTSPAYNISQAVRLTGSLRHDVLSQTVNEIVRRHEVLRTSFGLSPTDEPSQRIAETLELSIPVVDLQRCSGSEEEARALATALAARPFDLEILPLLRFVLVRKSSQEHLLLMSLHHVISDGWSSGILMREMAALYGDILKGQPTSLAPLPLQYVDFAAWQRNWLQGEVLDRQMSYWKGELEGAPGLLEMPTDRPRPPMQSFRGGRMEVALPAATSARLKDLGQRHGATLFMSLVAVFGALLYRTSGQRDLLIGYPIANRNRQEIEPLIGFFVNTLVLRARFPRGLSFQALVEEMRRVTLGAYSHQDLPFERLVEELHPQRDVSHTPLFQVMLTLQNAPLPSLRMPGLDLEFVRPDKTAVQLDLDITLREQPDGIRGILSFSRDLFDGATMQRLMNHWVVLAAAAVENPDLPVDRLDFLASTERHQILQEWNDTAVAYPLDRSFPDLFDEAVERFQDRTAVSCRDVQWSYRELAGRANALAEKLRDSGVARGDMVAVLGTRRPAMLAAILAIQKVGGAYLALDPMHPPGRLATILAASVAKVVLTEAGADHSLAPALEEVSDPLPVIVDLDSCEDDLGTTSLSSLASSVGPEDLAYVIFTSGSTGTPKGAMVHQWGLVNHLWLMIDALDLGPEDVLAQTASPCFDISVWQFLTPLLVGGRVEILPDEVVRDPQALARAVGERGLTVLQTVPSMLAEMLSQRGRGGEQEISFGELRWMIPTGEALPVSVREGWHEEVPEVPLLNAYGPAECSDDVTLQVLRPQEGEASVPIGRPVPNLQVLLVNGVLDLVPLGLVGEIVVCGKAVGRGYLGDPRRTAEVFVPDPWASTPGARLYRTGDLGSLRSDGVLEFAGRLDHQVKIRGFRIELGEVEAALERHPRIQEAVAVAETPEDGAEHRLVAYLACPPGGAPDVESLREHVKEVLPRYMVPAAFILLEEMPRNANGKVDREALARVGGTTLELARAFTPPSTATEEGMVEIWDELIGAKRIGVHDSFFDLGGNSLMATQLLSRVRERFAVELPLVTLFEAPTVAALAQGIDVALAARQAQTRSAEAEEDREEGEL